MWTGQFSFLVFQEWGERDDFYSQRQHRTLKKALDLRSEGQGWLLALGGPWANPPESIFNRAGTLSLGSWPQALWEPGINYLFEINCNKHSIDYITYKVHVSRFCGNAVLSFPSHLALTHLSGTLLRAIWCPNSLILFTWVFTYLFIYLFIWYRIREFFAKNKHLNTRGFKIFSETQWLPSWS
jgi:hypothetical protein